MGPKILQFKIIAGSIGETNYNRVRFLEAKDFTDFKDYKFQTMWQVIEKSEGYYPDLWKAAREKGIPLQADMMKIASLADYTNLELLGLMLLEANFRKYLQMLLMEMVSGSVDDVEIRVLQKIYEELEGEDIFELSDKLPDYTKPIVSEPTHKRILSFNRYVNERAKKVKL